MHSRSVAYIPEIPSGRDHLSAPCERAIAAYFSESVTQTCGGSCPTLGIANCYAISGLRGWENVLFLSAVLPDRAELARGAGS